jgi:hypothetical protein
MAQMGERKGVEVAWERVEVVDPNLQCESCRACSTEDTGLGAGQLGPEPSDWRIVSKTRVRLLTVSHPVDLQTCAIKSAHLPSSCRVRLSGDSKIMDQCFMVTVQPSLEYSYDVTSISKPKHHFIPVRDNTKKIDHAHTSN